MYKPIDVQLFLGWSQQDTVDSNTARLELKLGFHRNSQADTISPGLKVTLQKPELKALDTG